MGGSCVFRFFFWEGWSWGLGFFLQGGFRVPGRRGLGLRVEGRGAWADFSLGEASALELFA